MTNHGTAADPPSVDSSMQAIVQDAYGTVDVLRYTRATRPEIADDEVLARVRAAGLDRGTRHVMTGRPYLLRGKWTGGFGRTLRAPLVSPFVRQRLTMLASKERGSDLERLAEYLAAGTVAPSIDRIYPLDQVPAAMRHLETGQVRGKIAITIPEEGRS
jgi:NADPH:quinone reductase-like Zn-dependent oxidoreductase